MKYTIQIILLAFVILSGSRIAYAQTDTTMGDMSLRELLNVKVTTASRTLQELDLAPASVIVITKEQIKTRGYQSLLDLMVDLPDFKIDDKIYSGSRNSITIRGIQGQQNFFILLDGVKISSPTNEALPIMENYPLNLAEQIEIVYGPASALYGADAVAGVINIITRKAISDKAITVDASSVAGTYGYFNNTLYLSKSLGQRSSFVLSGQYCYDKQPDYSKIYKDDTLLSVAHYANGTFNTIFGPMTPSAPVTPRYEAPTTAYNIYGALHLEDFTISLFSNYTRLPNAWGNNTHNAVYNKDVFMDQKVTVVTANYRKTFDRITTTSTLTGTRYNLNPETNYRNLYTGMESVYKYSTSLSVKIDEQVDYRVSRTMNLTGGVTHERFATIPQSADLEAPVTLENSVQGSYAGTSSYYRPEGLAAQFYNILYHNSGAYFQAQYALARKINFTLGARYDYNSRYGNTFNPRLGIVYKASKRTTVKAMYGSAYLAPPPSTAFVTYGSFETADSGKTYTSSFLHLPNPKLGPVRSQTFELSLRQYFSDNLMVNIDGYYTRTTGLFAFADDNQTTNLYNNQFLGIPVSYIEVFINEGEQHSYGGSVQMSFKHAIGNVFMNSYGSVSYTGGWRNTTDIMRYRTDLSFIAPFMLRIGTDIKAGKFTCAPRLLIMGKQNLPGIADTTGTKISVQKIAGYALLNIALRYEPGRKIAFFANVTNALDQRYRAVGFNMDLNKKNTELLHGQPQDPIRVMGGISIGL